MEKAIAEIILIDLIRDQCCI